MGRYVNPGNLAFKKISGPKYVDKTNLIHLINERVDTGDCLVCVSRPRRFGKSYTAKMLTAYYDCSCDSHGLFDHRKIAESDSYEDHLNQYNVICLDISSFISEARSTQRPLIDVPQMMIDALRDDIAQAYPDLPVRKTLNDMLLACTDLPEGKPFVFIIDEWDAMIREAKNDDQAQEAYLNLLRGWFKDTTFTPRAVAAAFMTGILPIKKDGSQSAISEFDEYTMLEPDEFAEYVGFTEREVQQKCMEGEVDFNKLKAWYDGYDLALAGSIYNPYSVMRALKSGKCQSYWKKTSAAESLKYYINMNFDGLQETVARLIAGDQIPVNTDDFQNDFESFHRADDILTLLIHLGYLTYHETEGTVQIPNEEVRKEFKGFLSTNGLNAGWIALIKRSQQLLQDTLDGREEEVAEAMSRIRQEQYAPQFYNNEQSLRAVIKYAYFVAAGQYIRIEEMPGGKGIADVVFIPTMNSGLPVLVIELKWNKSAGGAISQIREKGYTANLTSYAGNILLVGINYDSKTGKHTCKIERM